jgi:protein Mpv17
MASYGGLIFGPAATHWYKFLAERVHLSTTNRSIAARIACDQFIFAPINMTLFLSSMAYLEGSSPKEKLKKAWVPGMKNNFLVWPWVQAVNFRFVPLEHRVLVVNGVALGESCFHIRRLGWDWRCVC